ncbi:MAG: type III polyketide synthase [Ekhidna sp.]
MPTFIQSIGTALPPFVTNQSVIADFMVHHLKLNEQEERNLRILYRASGIQQRYSVLEDFQKRLNDQAFFKDGLEFPTAKPRMEIYQKHAIQLAYEAVSSALKQTQRKEITHLITVSCTGMYAPGLDIELIEKLGLNTDIQRTSINFMGCYAAFNAMKMADQIVRANPESKVVVVCVELCSIHLQEKKDDENLLANAIFGDGAASLLVASEPSDKSLELTDFYSDLSLKGKKEMGWYIGDHGFEMKLSARVPDVIKEGISELTDRLFKKTEISISDIDFFAIHPGGKRILEVIEEKLNISKEQNQFARNGLKIHGNMSSPTVLFIMKSILDSLQKDDDQKHILSFAFGPGLTLESAILKTHVDA